MDPNPAVHAAAIFATYHQHGQERLEEHRLAEELRQIIVVTKIEAAAAEETEGQRVRAEEKCLLLQRDIEKMQKLVAGKQRASFRMQEETRALSKKSTDNEQFIATVEAEKTSVEAYIAEMQSEMIGMLVPPPLDATNSQTDTTESDIVDLSNPDTPIEE